MFRVINKIAPHVLQVRDRFHMSWPDATRGFAKMVDGQPFRNWTYAIFVGPSMSANQMFRLIAKTPITPWETSACPQPARPQVRSHCWYRSIFVDASPEAFFRWGPFPNKIRASRLGVKRIAVTIPAFVMQAAQVPPVMQARASRNAAQADDDHSGVYRAATPPAFVVGVAPAASVMASRTAFNGADQWSSLGGHRKLIPFGVRRAAVNAARPLHFTRKPVLAVP